MTAHFAMNSLKYMHFLMQRENAKYAVVGDGTERSIDFLPQVSNSVIKLV
jgi:hypothetical protein